MTSNEFIAAVEELNYRWRILSGGEIRTAGTAYSPLSAVYTARFGGQRSSGEWREMASALGLSAAVATEIHYASELIPPYSHELRQILLVAVGKNKQRLQKPLPIAEPFKEVSP